MVQPLTLARFAELTARLEQCESRQAILDQEGLPLQHWLSEQRRWLEEMSRRVALNRPRLFRHYCTIVEAERARLGLPPRIGGPSSPERPRHARVTVTRLDAPKAPDSPFPGGLAGAAEAPELPSAAWDIPEYLRAAGRLAPPTPGGAHGVSVPPLAEPSVVATPAPGWSGMPEPSAARRVSSAEAKGSQATFPPGLESPPPAPAPAVVRSNSRNRSEAPRLQLAEYAELTVLLEQTPMAQGSVLSRFGLDDGAWFDEVAYWNREFTEKRLDPKSFERLLAMQRGKLA